MQRAVRARHTLLLHSPPPPPLCPPLPIAAAAIHAHPRFVTSSPSTSRASIASRHPRLAALYTRCFSFAAAMSAPSAADAAAALAASKAAAAAIVANNSACASDSQAGASTTRNPFSSSSDNEFSLAPYHPKLNSKPPRKPTLPLSQPGDELQWHYLSAKPEFLKQVSENVWSEWEYIYRSAYDLNSVEEVMEETANEHMNDGELNCTFVATIDGKLAAHAELATEDVTRGHAYYGTLPWLISVYVMPEFRGRGVAHRLVEKMSERAADMGYTHLWLLTQHMQAAYRKSGFKVIETAEVFDHPYTVMRKDFAKQRKSFTEDDAKSSHAQLQREMSK